MDTASYWLTRFYFQRALGLIYLVAFLIAVNQYLPLLGSNGLMPVRLYLQSRGRTFWDAPSIFWLNCSDRFIKLVIWCGLGLSLLAVSGVSESSGLAFSMAVWAMLWFLYLSLVNVGQTFYGFGWEMLLLESGFLAIFLGANNTRPPVLIIWLYLWLLFRVMFGAGMIKIRADRCWRDLTCMYYHYETQPLPNPLSWYFHHLPRWVHKAAVLFNHFVELPVPWFYFAPPPLSWIAGGLTILFQVILIFSGNLSWLNYITIVLCIPCFDDSFFAHVLPVPHAALTASAEVSPVHQGLAIAATLLVLGLSIKPARNLFSRGQLMNASFNSLHLVNTYGAFGSVTRERMEVVIEGTNSPSLSAAAEWRAYGFKGKPGDVRRRPCIASPYHYKLDWQMWFAAMSPHWMHPWFLTMIEKLLRADPAILSLLAHNPFPDAPPKFIRAELYHYEFTEPAEQSGAWWKRSRAGTYLPPTSLEDLDLRYQ